METVTDFISLGSKITADGDCSHEIKRRLFLRRKVMTNLDSILKSRNITLPAKVHLVKAMVFPVVMYRCESWTIKKAQLLLNCGVGDDSWESLGQQDQTTLREINHEYSMEGLMLKLKLQNFGHLMQRANSLKRPWCWKRLRAREKGVTEDKMVGWHHWLNGQEFEQTPEDSEGQGSLACCSPWGHKEVGNDFATE